MNRKICYEILGLEYGDDLQLIKKAYRKLSTKFHPDKNDGDEYFTKMYIKVKDAYDYLISNINQNENNEKYPSSFVFDEIYIELRDLRFKLGKGTVFNDLEKLIHERITKELLTLSKQDELIKTGNNELIRKITNEVFIIFKFIKNVYYCRRLSTIIMNLSQGNPIVEFSITKILNIKNL